jgi:polysaccharide deacetylase family protein (PEP-CTERM system associated)
MIGTADRSPVNAFCIDLEEWFHICDADTAFDDPATWDAASSCVEADTQVLLDLLDEAGVKATFLTLGWIAERHPALVRRIADAGHEIGCHGYYHRLVFRQTRAEFRREITDARLRLQDLTGQAVSSFRAPGFSIRADTFWAYEVLAETGFHLDLSIVPARRGHGGVEGFGRCPLTLDTAAGAVRLFPMSVMRMGGRTVQFSGGGYLRFLPMPVVHHGFRQNHRLGLPVMTYIHPREVNPNHPRLPLPPVRRFRHYTGLRGCREKLRQLLGSYRFGTATAALADYDGRAPSRRSTVTQVAA